MGFNGRLTSPFCSSTKDGVLKLYMTRDTYLRGTKQYIDLERGESLIPKFQWKRLSGRDRCDTSEGAITEGVRRKRNK